MLQLDVEIDNDCVVTAEPLLGSMHRGAEKLFESRDYRQILSLANRHEWTSAITGEIGVAQLIENELGIVLPETAAWLRTLLLEVQRITSHLAFLAGYPWDDEVLNDQLRDSREVWVTHLQHFTGGRMHPMVTVFGGLSHAPSTQWLTELKELALKSQTNLRNLSENFGQQLSTIPHNLGTLTIDDVTLFSLSGPIARASGWQSDLRAQWLTLKYHAVESFTVTTAQTGDVATRLQLLLDEVLVSHSVVIECVEACLPIIDQPVNVLLPKVIRVPEGRYTSSIETPLGIAQWYLESRGDKYPYRLKLRPSSLHSILSLSHALKGVALDDVAKVVASLPFICGDADR